MRYTRTMYYNGEFHTVTKTDPRELVMVNENEEYTLKHCITPPMPDSAEWKPLGMAAEKEEEE